MAVLRALWDVGFFHFQSAMSLNGGGFCWHVRGENERRVFDWREESFVMPRTETVHGREFAHTNLSCLEPSPQHLHYGWQGGGDGDDEAILGNLLQLRARDDVSANDLALAWQLIAGSKALFKLEEALVLLRE